MSVFVANTTVGFRPNIIVFIFLDQCLKSKAVGACSMRVCA